MSYVRYQEAMLILEVQGAHAMAKYLQFYGFDLDWALALLRPQTWA